MTAPVACGVDVEKISGRTEKVAHKFLSETERKVPDNFDRELYFTLMWSAKESLFKITGRPDYLKHMKTLVFPRPGINFIEMEVDCKGKNKEFRVFYTTFDGHVLTWAYEG
jgi:4'-phosphopantetheinyl transferase EntD